MVKKIPFSQTFPCRIQLGLIFKNNLENFAPKRIFSFEENRIFSSVFLFFVRPKWDVMTPPGVSAVPERCYLVLIHFDLAKGGNRSPPQACRHYHPNEV